MHKVILKVGIMFGQWGQGYAGVDPAAQQMYWQQYYAAAGYPQAAQHFYGAYGSAVPGMPAAGTPGANPVPPAEPPKEVQPPLPAEPPPPDEKVLAFFTRLCCCYVRRWAIPC